jgi:phage baseplate assembly protein W
MAYNIKNISPLDLKPSTGIGVKIPFETPSVFQSVYTTKEQLRYNIINFLLTDPRERPFNPTFGAGLRSKVFEQIESSTAEDIKTSLMSQLESAFTAINITKLDVIGQPDTNSINIKFSYTIKNTRENDDVLLTIQNM